MPVCRSVELARTVAVALQGSKPGIVGLQIPSAQIATPRAHVLRERADKGIKFEWIGPEVDEIPDGTGSRVGEPVEERVVKPEVRKD